MNNEILIDIVDRLSRIENKVDAAAAKATDHEHRLRGLERFRNWGAGVAAAVGVAFPFIVSKGGGSGG